MKRSIAFILTFCILSQITAPVFAETADLAQSMARFDQLPQDEVTRVLTALSNSSDPAAAMASLLSGKAGALGGLVRGGLVPDDYPEPIGPPKPVGGAWNELVALWEELQHLLAIYNSLKEIYEFSQQLWGKAKLYAHTPRVFMSKVLNPFSSCFPQIFATGGEGDPQMDEAMRTIMKFLSGMMTIWDCNPIIKSALFDKYMGGIPQVYDLLGNVVVPAVYGDAKLNMYNIVNSMYAVSHSRKSNEMAANVFDAIQSAFFGPGNRIVTLIDSLAQGDRVMSNLGQSLTNISERQALEAGDKIKEEQQVESAESASRKGLTEVGNFVVP